jgi:hypothetical protein
MGTERAFLVAALGLAACTLPASGGGSPAARADDQTTEHDPRCAGLEGAATSEVDPAVLLSRTFALTRWFGVASVGRDVDASLVKAMTAASAGDALATFATDTSGCVVPSTQPIGEARVDMAEGVAIVHPGRGAIVIPDEATAVAIDLRGLAASSDLAHALTGLVPAIVAGTFTWPAAAEVRCSGMPDEASHQRTYKCQVVNEEVLPSSTSAVASRPIAVVTGARLAPEAALFAMALRLADKAWLVGHDVSAAVAESTAVPGKTTTSYVRTHVLSRNGEVIPDVVIADDRTSDPGEWLRTLPARGAPPHSPAAPTTRSVVVAVPKPSPVASDRADAAAVRASLVATHAAVRTFFPYFGDVADTWDAAYVQAMNAAGEVTTARALIRLLGAMTTGLEDGHVSFVSNDPGARTRGYAALDVAALGDDVIVTRSKVPGIERGDRLVTIGAAPVAARFAEAMAHQSGSPGRRRRGALRALLELDAPAPFTIERAGATLTVNVPLASSTLMGSAWSRARGALADLGAADTYYVSLDADDLEGADIASVAAEAKSHRAIVLDMRGYPGASSWRLIAHLIPGAATGCQMHIATASRRGELGRTALPIPRLSTAAGGVTAPPFTGPMAILVGSGTQSAAEHLTFFFRNGGYAKLIGENTSGANGNVTGLQLASGLTFKFTGMEIRHPDGARFHGLGLEPDVRVEPTRADITIRKDTVLARGIEVLRN